MDKNQCFELGYIAKVHGLDGSVVAMFDVDDPDRYKKIDVLFIEQGAQLVPFSILRISGQKGNQRILSLSGVSSAADAAGLKGCKLFLPEVSLPALKDHQYYFHELVGTKVKDAKAGLLGEIREIVDLPHQTLAIMEWKGVEVLIPVHENIVEKFDRKTNLVHTRLPDGLLEVYTKPDEKEEEYAN
jgi:16S rRNA processing protein RimM